MTDIEGKVGLYPIPQSGVGNVATKIRGELGRRYSSDLGRRVSQGVMSLKSAKPKFPPTVVVSNRLPFVLKKGPDGTFQRHSSAGGLVTAVAPVVADSGGLWVGWSGLYGKEAEKPIPEADPEDNTPTAGITSEQIVPVILERDEFENYYNGCCNGTFWPLFHSMPDRAVFKMEHYNAYVKANEKFAQQVMVAVRKLKQKSENKNKEILVWIHDYHLMLAPTMVRELAESEDINIKLGFFLHIPFPPWDIFRIFPRNADILLGLLGCGMLGFHIDDYCKNFVDCCRRLLGCRVDSTHLLVEHGRRTVKVRPLPIGIPFKRFEQLAQEAPATGCWLRVRQDCHHMTEMLLRDWYLSKICNPPPDQDDKFGPKTGLRAAFLSSDCNPISLEASHLSERFGYDYAYHLKQQSRLHY